MRPITLIAMLFFVATPVFAAEIRIDAKSQEMKAGEQFEAGIFLNTEEEYVNAVEGTIVFPNDVVELKEIRDGNSVVNFWIERPRVVEADSIDFSGIIPGGYQDTRGFLFSIVFRAKTKGEGAIAMRNIKVLLNDGKGTPAEVTISNFPFLVQDLAGHAVSQDSIVKDTERPETFHPAVARDESLFDGKWFLVFATQDKGSGVDHYEVREGAWGGFRIAQSPHLLQNQKLDKKIFVKAVDKSGNERSEILYPPYWRHWYKNYWILGILIMGVMLIAYIVRKMYGQHV